MARDDEAAAFLQPKRAWLFPGQGTQRRGMGAALFDLFPNLVEAADAILGYSVRTLCVDDPEDRLGATEFSQPALYVVNALQFLDARRREPWPDFVAGHSLGEYNALFAAGVFDFETGLRIVQARARWMSSAGTGTMLAVIGLEREALAHRIDALGLDEIDFANYNLEDQTVLSGPDAAIARIDADLSDRDDVRTVHLRVGGAFHSRYASAAAAGFAEELARFPLRDPDIVTVSSATARPVGEGEVRAILASQITMPVDWLGAMRFLRRNGVEDARQIGPGRVLDGLWERFRDPGIRRPASNHEGQ